MKDYLNMNPLNQISKEEIEKFRSEFVEGGSECTWVNYPVVEEVEQFIKSSHLRLIDGMCAELNKFIEKNSFTENKCDVIYTAELAYLVDSLQSEKENIINPLTPKGEEEHPFTEVHIINCEKCRSQGK